MTLHQTKIYQSSDGDWIYFDGTNKNYFDTESEARNMEEKVKFATGALQVLNELIVLAEKMPGIRETYDDRFYASGESNEITDVDIAVTKKTAEDLESGMTLMTNFIRFLDNDPALVAGDYRTTLNKLRTDI